MTSGDTFPFGENWLSFLSTVDAERIESAKSALTKMVGPLSGKTFLDVGSGSGLSSLAAHELGAIVRSFDYDASSVSCTKELQRRFAPRASQWEIDAGSILDEQYLQRLKTYDVVYSWGVLHHTGDMYGAFANLPPLVKHKGLLFIAIYNDQGARSRYWILAKRLYNRSLLLRWLSIAFHIPLFIARVTYRFLTNRLRLSRGMSLWHDYIDWLGGYPFEVARPEDVLNYFRKNGFELEKLKTCGGRSGCNEYVFRKTTS